MSRFTGKQHKGAMALYRDEKRKQAERRNATANARRRFCGHIHGDRTTETAERCDHCEGPATHKGWAFPSGGSFPVTGCLPCLEGLAQDMTVNVAPIASSPEGRSDA